MKAGGMSPIPGLRDVDAVSITADRLKRRTRPVATAGEKVLTGTDIWYRGARAAPANPPR